MLAPHPPEFHQRAVELARLGEQPIAALAKQLSISESCLRNWMAQADADDNNSGGSGGGTNGRLTTAEKKELNSPSSPRINAAWRWRTRS